MDHDLLYLLSMTMLYPLFQASDIFEQYPSDISYDDLIEKVNVYLGDRYEYFQYLLNNEIQLKHASISSLMQCIVLYLGQELTVRLG